MSLATAALALAVGALVLLAGLRWFHQSRVFRPERARAALDPHPGCLNLAFDDVWLEGGAGRLHGWWLPAARADAGTILICHGNAGNISGRVESAAFYRNMGLNVFIFDYRGYGLSDGRPSERGLYEDAATAWAYLTDTRGIAPRSVVLLGRSLGGGVASHLALHCKPGAVIIESTFLSIPDMARERYPWLPLSYLPWSRFDNASRIDRIESPLLIVHSVEDEVIPFAHGEALHRLRDDSRALVRIHGSHSGGYTASGEAYAAPVRAFLQDAGFELLAPG